MRSVSDGWQIRRENELVGNAEVRDYQERLLNSKNWIYQQRGFESKIMERKFE